MSMKAAILSSNITLWQPEDFAQFQKDFMSDGIANLSANGTDLKVSQRAAGINMSVDVAVGAAYKSVTVGGRTWRVRAENFSLLNITIPANSSGANRVDAIVLTIDTTATPDLVASNVATIERVAGSGVSALSDGAITTALGHSHWMRLANVTVANGAVTIADAAIADTRTVVTIGNSTTGYKSKFAGDGSGLTNLVFNSTDVNSITLPDDGSGIVAGNAAWVKSTGNVTKLATIRTFLGQNTIFYADGDITVGESISDFHTAPLSGNLFAAMWTQQTATSTYTVMTGVGMIDRNGGFTLFTYNNLTNSGSYNPGGNNALLVRLSDSKFITAFPNSSGSSYTVNVHSVDLVSFALTKGTNQSVGSEANYFGMDRISDTAFVIATRDSSTDDLFVYPASVSGTTITLGSSVTFDAGVIGHPTVLGLTSTKAIIAWSNGTSILTRTANVAANVVTAGAGSYIVASFNSKPRLAKINSTTFGVLYNDTTATIAKVVLGSEASDVIGFGTAISLGNYSTNGGGFALQTYDVNGLVAYWENSNTGMSIGGTLCYITTNGTAATLAFSIVVNQEYQIGQDDTWKGFMVVQGKVVIPSIPTASKSGGLMVKVLKPDFNESFLGIASGAASGGNVAVITQNVTGDIYSGLTIGTSYFASLDGTISANGVLELGRAIKTTNILLRPILR